MDLFCDEWNADDVPSSWVLYALLHFRNIGLRYRYRRGDMSQGKGYAAATALYAGDRGKVDDIGPMALHDAWHGTKLLSHAFHAAADGGLMLLAL